MAICSCGNRIECASLVPLPFPFVVGLRAERKDGGWMGAGCNVCISASSCHQFDRNYEIMLRRRRHQWRKRCGRIKPDEITFCKLTRELRSIAFCHLNYGGGGGDGRATQCHRSNTLYYTRTNKFTRRNGNKLRFSTHQLYNCVVKAILKDELFSLKNLLFTIFVPVSETNRISNSWSYFLSGSGQ